MVGELGANLVYLTKSDLQLVKAKTKQFLILRGAVKYYFADFVCKGEGGTPQIHNPLFAENFVCKGGYTVDRFTKIFFLEFQ